MVVPALALDRLDDDGGDIVLVLVEGRPDLGERERLARLHVFQIILAEREPYFRIQNAGPIELREIRSLPGIGRVGQGERVAGASVECLLEMEHLVPALLAVAAREVLADLPVEGGLERVLDAKRAAGD